MTDTITHTNPATGETWTSGKRGRKPKWVSDLEATGTVIPTKAPITTTKPTQAPHVTGQLRVWKYVGQSGEEGNDDRTQQKVRCFIVASNPLEALQVANPTFQFPISSSEFKLLWQELDHEMIGVAHQSGINVTAPGIWEGKNNAWITRTPSKSN